MNTTPPFPFPPLPGVNLLQNLLDSFQPPAWVVDEVQNKVVLLLNHVLLQEPQAQDRVRRQKGKSARMVWGKFEMTLQASPAGLLERVAQVGAGADLTVVLTEVGLPAVLEKVARGDKPAVNIEGDVQLAAEVAWLVDNLRWDVEEDLSRLIGDAPAHTLCKAAAVAGAAVKAFAGRVRPAAGGAAAAP